MTETAPPVALVDSSEKGEEVEEAGAGVEETGDLGDPKVLSKKQKEKLKKDKEKAKKKAQAAAKKAGGLGETGGTTSATPSAPPSLPPSVAPSMPASTAAPEGDEEEDAGEEEGGGGGGGAKNKKKKKKKASEPAKEEPKKKAGGKLGALRAAMEERQRIEAEAKAKADEAERKQLEEEERVAAEEKRAAEEKARRKEKEKAKKEELRKAGKLLTPKQKIEKAAAEARLAALVASGVQVAGLQPGSSSGPPGSSTSGGGKKPNYGKKKAGGGGGAKKDLPIDKAAEVQGVSEPKAGAEEPASSPIPVPVVVVEEESKEDVKDDWAESSAEEDDGVKDDWDAESTEEEEEEKEEVKPKPKTPAASVNAAPPSKLASQNAASKATKGGKASPAAAATKGKAATKDAGKANAAPKATATNGKAQTPAEPEQPSSEGDEDEDEEEDDDDDDSGSNSDSDSDDDSDDDDSDDEEGGKGQRAMLALQKKQEAAARRIKRVEDAMAARNPDDMRSPICCILGHVDTGKTKLLDKIRQTNVQEGEAGGITQQIGATFFPMESIRKKTLVLGANDLAEYKLPGLLVIDTPGHESFTNLRSRGSSLCNIAILVVDIMHGLEPQTLESLKLLRDKKTPFVVALNKIDRLYGWQAVKDNSFRDSLSKQVRPVQREFDNRLKDTIIAFAEQGLNAVPYYENTNYSKNVSLIPTSAITGEGIPDLLMLLIKLTQERMSERLMYLSELECTVLEVKVVEGLGTTIDVVLSNGVLREGDKIVVCGMNGPIVTQVRALLTPEKLRELRIKGNYVHHKEVKASLGIKIVAPDLEKAIAGSRLLLLTDDDDEEDLKEEVMGDLTNMMSNVDKSGRGVCVQASTLGSLEALLEFLRTSKIPVSGINIGPVYKRDVMRAGTMLEKARELAVILAFDVPIDKDAEKMAEETGIKIFKADIIYHLFDAFTAYNASILAAKRADSAPIAVWPCRLKIIAVFTKRDPIIVGCDILEGTLRVGTPLCVVKLDPTTKKKTTIVLGKVTSLEINHKSVQTLKKEQAGGGVAVKIEHAVYQSAMTYGRQFDDKDELISQISRQSIDSLKEVFRAEVSKEEWALIVRLKKELDIV